MSSSREYPARTGNGHMEEGRKGHMVKGDDGHFRWERRDSPDYDRGRPDVDHQDRQERGRRGMEDGRGAPGWEGFRRGGGGPTNQGYGVGGRADFFEQRRLDRLNSSVTIWPPSPPHAYGAASDSQDEDRHHRKKKSRKHRSSRRYDSVDSEEEEEERRRRRRKREKERERDRDRDRGEGKKKKRERTVSPSPDGEGGEEWVERPGASVPAANAASVSTALSHPAPPPPALPPSPSPSPSSSSGDEIGPMPYNPVTGKPAHPKDFGKALRPGEGSAIAAYVESGQRIPRRGEIGLKGDQIEKFEAAGFVMSGSRHRRMNAVRIRKENQVISAEEKRAILKVQAEEKEKREQEVVASFRELIDTKLNQSQPSTRP